MQKFGARSRRFVALSLAMLLITALAACSEATEPDTRSVPLQAQSGTLGQGNAVCGYSDVLPSPAMLDEDPCHFGELVTSKHISGYTWGGGGADATFNVSGESHVCVTVETAGSLVGPVLVDGELVRANPNSSGQAGGTDYSLQLSPGTHAVEVPGAFWGGATVEVRATDVRPGQATVWGQNGILETHNVATDHSLFSPNGDGFHDGTEFFADNYPWYLPGEFTGQFDFWLNWEWEVIDAESCNSLGVVVAGQTQVHSPAHVAAPWDGVDPSAATSVSALSGDTASALVPDGRYLYIYRADLMRSDGLWIDSVQSHPRGMLIDSTSRREPNSMGPMTFNPTAISNPNYLTTCDPSVDPDQCDCPSNLPAQTRCTNERISDLESFEDPSSVSTGDFITTTHDSTTGRYTVKVDLREYNGGGLVPQGNGTWSDINELQAYVEDLTGVPADQNQERLFNFDYVQLGYSTPVTSTQAITGFNHFLLDVITDSEGKLHIDGTTYDLPEIFANGESNIPAAYQIANDRHGDECYVNGNTDGSTDVEARACTELRMANLDPGDTDLGIYRIKTRIFEVLEDEEGTERESYCLSGGDCGVRTVQRDAAMFATRYLYQEDNGTLVQLGRLLDVDKATPALVVETDRFFDDGGSNNPVDGVCMSGVANRAGMDIHLASGDGALPSSCIINGISY